MPQFGLFKEKIGKKYLPAFMTPSGRRHFTDPDIALQKIGKRVEDLPELGQVRTAARNISFAEAQRRGFLEQPLGLKGEETFLTPEKAKLLGLESGFFAQSAIAQRQREQQQGKAQTAATDPKTAFTAFFQQERARGRTSQEIRTDPQSPFNIGTAGQRETAIPGLSQEEARRQSEAFERKQLGLPPKETPSVVPDLSMEEARRQSEAFERRQMGELAPNTHVARTGETPQTVAEEYNVPVEEVIKANQHLFPDLPPVGDAQDPLYQAYQQRLGRQDETSQAKEKYAQLIEDKATGLDTFKQLYGVESAEQLGEEYSQIKEEYANLLSKQQGIESQLEDLPEEVRKKAMDFVVSASALERMTAAEAAPLAKLYANMSRTLEALNVKQGFTEKQIKSYLDYNEKDQAALLEAMDERIRAGEDEETATMGAYNDYLSLVKAREGLKDSPDVTLQTDVNDRGDKTTVARDKATGEELWRTVDEGVGKVKVTTGGFTPTEQKKLEQAGLTNASRQDQLDFLYGEEEEEDIAQEILKDGKIFVDRQLAVGKVASEIDTAIKEMADKGNFTPDLLTELRRYNVQKAEERDKGKIKAGRFKGDDDFTKDI